VHSVLERWGSFSVIDHINAAAIVPEILLYDRLLIPFPPNDTERKRWEKNLWKPKILDQRLSQLGNLAIKVPWDKELQEKYQKKMEHLKQIKFEGEGIPFGVTKMILAQSEPKDLPEDVSRVDVVSAYQSEEDIRADFIINNTPNKNSHLAFLLGQKIVLPTDANPEVALDKAIKLAKKPYFKEKRRSLYEWQNDIIEYQNYDEIALKEMDLRIKGFNQCVQTAVKKFYYKFAFTIGTFVLAMVGGAFLNPWVTASSILSVIEFMTLDKKPVIQAGKNEVAAMFHTIKKKLKWDIK